MVRNLAGNILTRCFRQKYSILFSSKVSKMSTELNWKSEKYKYLTTYQTRNRDDWIPLQGLKTWKQYAQDKDLPHPAAPLAGNIIDNTNNESLSDKISIFNGDITNLKHLSQSSSFIFTFVDMRRAIFGNVSVVISVQGPLEGPALPKFRNAGENPVESCLELLIANTCLDKFVSHFR
ncbi:hypothetical protein HUJ04_001465 [Dendroctonus ponderosae]|nr:hypothetical protein HUJ04_001465 [Dendroctonus ponderosae]